MAKMDERTKAELFRINQDKLFTSVIIIAIFLIIKICAQISILGMLGEITAAAVILLYLLPYFIIRYSYKTIDEMVKIKLYKLSTVFLALQAICLLAVLIIDFIIIFSKANETINIMNSSFPFIISLELLINFYGLIRTYNEKFVSQRAAETSLRNYKGKLLIRAIFATVFIIALSIAFILINNYLSEKAEYVNAVVLSVWTIVFSMGIFWCILGVPACWILYCYYLGIRKKLEKKLIQKTAYEARLIEHQIDKK